VGWTTADRAPHRLHAQLRLCAVSSSPTLGIDVGGTKVESALVDASGTVLSAHRHPTNADRGGGRVLDDIVACVDECLSDAAHRQPR
jgi:predicted NBD/HSP70 family sugar kinase